MNLSALPPWLDRGSTGPAVTIVQAALAGAGFFAEPPNWGIYDEQTETAVLRLQDESGTEKDGNFGPATREAFEALMGLDLNQIPLKSIQGPTSYYGPESPEAFLWGE